MNKRIWVLLLLAGCGGQEKPAGVLGTLEAATAAEAWRIAGDPRKPGDYDYFAYSVISGPVSLSNSLRSELTKTLWDPRIRSDNVHPCIPSPGVKVRYSRPNAAPLWIFFCFECHELFVYEDAAQQDHKGFDDAVGDLAAVMKKIFPNDAVIQGLK